VRTWDLRAIDAPDGTRDAVVLDTKDDARAVLVALSPGQQLGEHQVKERAWLVVVDGTVEVSAGDETQTWGVGTLAMFDPHERHALRSEAGARILMLFAPWPGAGHFHAGER
jgi:quercetin dioxygenase-like cupin family protein